jgi:sialidase-1
MIKTAGHKIIYENPIPNLLSRHAYFPGLVELPSGDILALFSIGEAFESAMKIFVSRSRDSGNSWELEGPIHKDFEASKMAPGSMKPTLLRDGTLIALGYGFTRGNPEIFFNPETGGLPNGANYISFSQNEGRTWTKPEALSLPYPEILETSGPCVELENGDIIITGTPFPMWNGTLPSGNKGFLLRSRDKGKTWEDNTVFYNRKNITPYETRACEMKDGRIVIMIWCSGQTQGKNVTNHVVVSNDSGVSWSDPIDTGVQGQASNLLYLKNNKFLAVHCQREVNIGLYVDLVDFSGDEWKIIERKCIWNKAVSAKTRKLSDMGTSLKFGQPSFLKLDNGDILLAFWATENGQGRILSHRIHLVEDFKQAKDHERYKR